MLLVPRFDGFFRFFKLFFQSVFSKLVYKFEGPIWTVSKKDRGPEPLEPTPPPPSPASCAPAIYSGSEGRKLGLQS